MCIKSKMYIFVLNSNTKKMNQENSTSISPHNLLLNEK